MVLCEFTYFAFLVIRVPTDLNSTIYDVHEKISSTIVRRLIQKAQTGLI